jgi:hypothetical protein
MEVQIEMDIRAFEFLGFHILLLGYLSLLFYPHTGFIVNIGGEYDHEE